MQSKRKQSRCSVKPADLRCEYRKDPLGLQERNPRLSWKLTATNPKARAQRQTAYRIVVATTRKRLESGRADLWDTGKVGSDRCNQIPYQGTAPSPGVVCWWRVRAWDEANKASGWSEPSRWSMGPLSQEDWEAKWIGYEAPPRGVQKDPLSFWGSKWIWYPEGDPRESAPPGSCYLRRTLDLPVDKVIRSARFLVTADDQFTLYVNGSVLGKSDGNEDSWRRPVVFDVSANLKSGRNALALEATNLKPGPAGALAKLIVQFDNGQMELVTDREWRASKTTVPGWSDPGLDDLSWPRAREVTAAGHAPWGYLEPSGLELHPLPYMRKDFDLPKKVSRAHLHVAALGTCQIRLNGKLVTDDLFVPGRSDFRKRAYYRTYDVTGLVRRGRNAIAAILADEWYAGYCGGWGRRRFYGREPRLLVQLEIELVDGSKQRIVTDSSWKARYGPIRESDMFMGETYDARLEVSGWDRPEFDDGAWDPVVVDHDPNLALTWHPGPPVRRIVELTSKAVDEVAPGVHVFDLGQNIVGWARMEVRGASPGQRILMRFAEAVRGDGTIYVPNLRAARNADTYVCRGLPEETWEPTFSFRGFRYVEVTGCSGKALPDAITGVVVHSDFQMLGSFSSSNPLLDRLVENIVWSLRGNYLEVPTDCPQRDERQGWTGDAQVFCRTASYLADLSAFMTKWLVDVNDGQREDGAYPDVAPVVGAGFGTPAWGDAGIVIPYILHAIYGDTRLIERHHDSMARYIDYLARNAETHLRPAIGYGDWVPAGSDTPKDVLATAYFAHVTRLMAEMASAIGRHEDANRYRRLFEEVRDAFNRAYVSEDGRMKGETQTCYVLALYMDLLPEGLRQKAVERLAEDIRRRGWHLSTGFLGTSMLLPVLSRFDQLDIAYTLLLRETYPSWLHTVKCGATTIWERWNGWTHDHGFYDPGMNSFNHYAFGAVGEWLFATVAGIDADSPGFRRIRICPHPSLQLPRVGARYESIMGPIRVDWSVNGAAIKLSLTVPPNTTATCHLPTDDPARVKESGRPIHDAEGVGLVETRPGKAILALAPGSYRFVAPLRLAKS